MSIKKEIQGTIPIVHDTPIALWHLYRLLNNSTQQNLKVVVLHTLKKHDLTMTLFDAMDAYGGEMSVYSGNVFLGTHKVTFVTEEDDINDIKTHDIAYLGGIKLG